jgi:hypothetical protein
MLFKDIQPLHIPDVLRLRQKAPHTTPGKSGYTVWAPTTEKQTQFVWDTENQRHD